METFGVVLLLMIIAAKVAIYLQDRRIDQKLDRLLNE